MDLGGKIRKLRKRRNITQEVLARAMGVSFQAVSKWETGAAMPDLTMIPALASFFGVSTDELLDYNKYENDRVREEIVTRAAEIRAERPAEAEKILREGLRKFPGDDILLNNLLYTLDPESQGEEMEDICKALMESASCDDVRFDAARILAELYAGRGETAMCEATLERIPEIYFTKLELMAELLRGEKALDAAADQFGISLCSAVQMAAVMYRRLQEAGDAQGAESWRRTARGLARVPRCERPRGVGEGWLERLDDAAGPLPD